MKGIQNVEIYIMQKDGSVMESKTDVRFVPRKATVVAKENYRISLSKVEDSSFEILRMSLRTVNYIPKDSQLRIVFPP